MAGHRVFLRAEVLAGADDEGCLRLEGEAARYLGRVLRLRAGDGFEAFDGEGQVRAGQVLGEREGGLFVRLGPPRPGIAPATPLTLMPALLKGEKMAQVVQKACELGVSVVCPVITERCVDRPAAQKLEARRARWEKIAEEACRQCGRADLPRIEGAGRLPEAIDALGPPGPRELRLVAWEGATAKEGLRHTIERAGPIDSAVLVIGPEGGLSEAEVAQLASAGFLAVAMGPRILRAETASIALVSALRFALGELG